MTHSPLEAPRWSQELDEFPTGLAWTKDLSSLAVATASLTVAPTHDLRQHMCFFRQQRRVPRWRPRLAHRPV